MLSISVHVEISLSEILFRCGISTRFKSMRVKLTYQNSLSTEFILHSDLCKSYSAFIDHKIRFKISFVDNYAWCITSPQESIMNENRSDSTRCELK